MRDALRQINADIWAPFSRSYPVADVEGYLALHAPDFTFVQAGGRFIEDLTEHGTRVRKIFADLTDGGVTIAVAFRFVERIASAHLASERGVFRLTGTTPDGPRPVRYGLFHTIARRDDVGWRLVLDYEPADTESIGADEFAAAADVDDVERFA